MSSLDMTHSYSPCRCPVKVCIWELLRAQAGEIVKKEPILLEFVNEAILDHASFGEALAYRLVTLFWILLSHFCSLSLSLL